MQPPGFRPSLGVLYDADFGARLGSALSLCLLYGLDGKNECRITSISVSKPSLRAAAAAEIFGRFYAGAVSGDFGAIGRNLPTGLATDGGDPTDTPIIKAIVDKPGRQHGLRSLNDTAEPIALLRNALTAQQDQNCVIILNGPATNLARLLDLPGAKGWIERKARLLSIAESGFIQDKAAADKLLKEWPGQIAFAPANAGPTYPVSSFANDFAWTTNGHPILDAYQATGLTSNIPAPELAAALHAVREKDQWFHLSAPGNLALDSTGSITLSPTPGGRHRLLQPDPAKQDKLQALYAELVSAKPVPRPSRFRSQQQQQNQAVPPPAAKK